MVLESLIDRVALERHDIGRAGRHGFDTYLTRWVLWGSRYGVPGAPPAGAVYLHRFRRGDRDQALHDHPWPFTSVILWGGYWEWTADARGVLRRRWYGPGRVLKRPSGHRHRVELPAGRECWTLVFKGAKERSWKFWCVAAGRLTGMSAPGKYGNDFNPDAECMAHGSTDSNS